MAESAHAYVRGSTKKFYQWLETSAGKSVPQGPAVWICGDCHVGNIGPLADKDGKVEIQIRDLDQTCLGNPAHDLIRLGLSLATASRGSDLPGSTAVRILEAMVEGYEEALTRPRQVIGLEVDDLAPIRSVLKRSRSRAWHNLAEERIEDITPQIPLGEKFWTLKEEEQQAIAALFLEDDVRAKILKFKGRDSDTKISVFDAAYWMKGCSSLGRLRYAVLLGIGKRRNHEYCLIDLKEATSAAVPEGSTYANQTHAERVVSGACALSPNLGERMLAVTLMKRPVVLRELMPQDLKFDLDRLSQEEAIAAAHYLAGVVGRAHGRQMDAQTRTNWKVELRKRHSKSLDAPSWLWSSVVALIGEHEVAYLEHCRRFSSFSAEK